MKDIKKHFKLKEKSRICIFTLLAGIIFIMVQVTYYVSSPESLLCDKFVDDCKSFNMIKNFMSLFMMVGALGLIFKSFSHRSIISGISTEFPIYSIKSDTRSKGDIGGAFILGFGSVGGTFEEADYYVFFKKGDFGLIKDKVDASSVELVQTDDIETSYKEVYVDGELKNFIFVPKNTVKKNISIDL